MENLRANDAEFEVWALFYLQGVVDGNTVLVNRITGKGSVVSAKGTYLKTLRVDPDLSDVEMWAQAVEQA